MERREWKEKRFEKKGWEEKKKFERRKARWRFRARRNRFETEPLKQPQSGLKWIRLSEGGDGLSLVRVEGGKPSRYLPRR
ncbi:hypothetical protein CEXT_298951 [Caerostris extrusa]|uniref:Uncharacterized protein n=1 Tax=Caerostris extrusa TaxID=172846 RepID=A0AAV4V7N1_CAEEX|nr:hypothetical protein CEXT_298951 [Caerostris extrusa]